MLTDRLDITVCGRVQDKLHSVKTTFVLDFGGCLSPTLQLRHEQLPLQLLQYQMTASVHKEVGKLLVQTRVRSTISWLLMSSSYFPSQFIVSGTVSLNSFFKFSAILCLHFILSCRMDDWLIINSARSWPSCCSSGVRTSAAFLSLTFAISRHTANLSTVFCVCHVYVWSCAWW